MGKRNMLKRLGIVITVLTLTAGIGVFDSASSSTQGTVKKAGNKQILQKALKLQMPFIANQGQIKDGRVKFYAKIFGGSVYVTQKGEIIYSFPPSVNHKSKIKNQKSRGFVLKEVLVGAKISQPTGVDPSPAKVNYFIGNDKTKWKTNIPTFNKVSLGTIYKGIDLSLKAYGNNAEKIFTVHPGAEPKSIKLKMEGAKSLKINEKGELEAETGHGPVRFSKPIAFQEKDGKRKNVQVAYHIDKDTYGFKAGDYDRSLPLIIDPALVYSTYLGGSGDDQGYGIAVDSTGCAYVTGQTDSISFVYYYDGTGEPRDYFPTDYLFTDASGGLSDSGQNVFITKFNPAGDALVYSTYLGGSDDDLAMGIAVHSTGNVYVSGFTYSEDFPIQGDSSTAYQESFGGGLFDAFITKLSPLGDALVYSTYLGGSGNDESSGLAVDTAGNAYVTGTTTSNVPSFPTVNACQASYGGGTNDAFVTKLSPSGDALVYSTYLGGTSDEYGFAIAIDSAGIAYVTGYTGSGNFPTQNPYQGALSGTDDAFIAKIDPSISGPGSLIYSTYLGGTLSDHAYGIAVDNSGDVYITGNTNSVDFPTINPYQVDNAGGEDCFIARLDPSQTGTDQLIYSTYLGGTLSDYGKGIALDGSGNIYIAGITYGDFPTQNPFQETHAGNLDVFVSKLDPAQSGPDQLIYSTYLGGSVEDRVGDGHIALDTSDNVYITGFTSSTLNFPTEYPYQPDYGGGIYDAFVVKLTEAGPFGVSSVVITGLNESADGKYCAPIPIPAVVINFTGAAGQQVHVYWYVDDSIQYDYTVTADFSQIRSSLHSASDTVLQYFNYPGTHTVRVEVEDTGGTLLGFNEKDYETVDCASFELTLTLEGEDTYCEGGFPSYIAGSFSPGSSGEQFFNGNWVDELGNVVSTNLPIGDFNAANYIPDAFSIFLNTPGTHYLSLQIPVDIEDPVDTFSEVIVSDMMTFEVIPCGTGNGIISGIVDDGTSPIPNVHVYAVVSGTDEWMAGTNTADDGSYTLVLPAGTYKVNACATCSDLLFVNEWYDNVYNSADATDVPVTAPDNTPNINFSLEQGSTISGRVTNTNGAAIANVCVNATGLCGDPWYAGSQTDENGDYSIVVPAGDYYVSTHASCQSSLNYIDEWYDGDDGVIDCNAAVAVNPTIGTPASEIDFSLASGGTISGQITTPPDDLGDPIPLANVCVNAFNSICSADNPVMGGQTDDQGNYSFVLPAGDYYISTHAACQTPQSYVNEWYDRGDGTLDCNEATPETVTTGGTTTANFSLASGGTISGQVLSDGSPLANVSVDAHSPDGLGFGATTENNGNYTITGLPFGNYRVASPSTGRWGSGDDNYVTEFYDNQIYQSSATLVSISDILPDKSDIDFSLEVGATISGVIYQSDEVTLIPNVHVYALDSGTGEWMAGTNTADSGAYTLVLPSGTYKISACATCSDLTYVNEWYNENEDDVYNSGNATAVSVTAPGAISGINFSLDPAELSPVRCSRAMEKPLSPTCMYLPWTPTLTHGWPESTPTRREPTQWSCLREHFLSGRTLP